MRKALSVGSRQRTGIGDCRRRSIAMATERVLGIGAESFPSVFSASSVVKKDFSVSPCLCGERSRQQLRKGTVPFSPRENRDSPRAFTLVELLVVISIMILLAAYVLPKMQPAAEGRRLREAARMTNVFLSRARARAIETGRPCGVLFQPLENPIIIIDALGNEQEIYSASNVLYQVEVPPPYAGQATNSRVTVQAGGGSLVVTATASGDFPVSPTIVNSGDLIQLNNQGPWYQITLVAADQLRLTIDPARLGRIPPFPPTAQIPFTILRRPAPTIAPPLRLPTDTVVDLSASGTTQVPNQFGQGVQNPVMVLFSPNGSVNRCYWFERNVVTGLLELRAGIPSEPIFLLIGRESQVGLFEPKYDSGAPGTALEQLSNQPNEKKPNWQLPDNLWITIASQTGLVSVSENNEPADYYDSQDADRRTDWWSSDQGIDEAREFAKQSRSMGGR